MSIDVHILHDMLALSVLGKDDIQRFAIGWINIISYLWFGKGENKYFNMIRQCGMDLIHSLGQFDRFCLIVVTIDLKINDSTQLKAHIQR